MHSPGLTAAQQVGEHEELGGIKCYKYTSRNSSSLRCAVPHTFATSAFGGAWQQPGFKVQLSVHKDGACIAGGPGERIQHSVGRVDGRTKAPCVCLPTAATPQLSGCLLTKISAAPPNFLQAHFTSNNTPGVQPPPTAHSGDLPAAAAQPAAADGSNPHSFLSRTTSSLLLGFKRAWQQPGFKVQLSVHKDGACIAGGPGDREQRSLCSSGSGSDNRCVIIPTAATPQLSGCRLTKIKAAPPNFMQCTSCWDAWHRAAAAAAVTFSSKLD
ncbi:hypothetical protein OEZ85_004982 [Tetradesmus obliquus]|uniref:Pherophorin domain-containing protein n=1 Tax=Tetradesmus obliquus TaxID=3088 RepID=A0ABY8UJY1_TETOB|nr:hypothetical protein OEZ85_004982 [Tetradesmus obliquus]